MTLGTRTGSLGRMGSIGLSQPAVTAVDDPSTVGPPVTPPEDVFDDFDGRTTGPDDWGDTSSGSGTWLAIDGGVGDSGVAGGLGTLHVDTSGGFSTVAEADIIPTAPYLLRGGGGFDLVIRFKVDGIAATGESSDEIIFSAYGATASCGVEISPDLTTGLLWLNGASYAEVDFTDWSANTMYIVHWHQEHQTGTASASIWRAADPEPGSFMVTRDPSGDSPGSNDGFGIQLTLASDITDLTASFDSIVNAA